MLFSSILLAFQEAPSALIEYSLIYITAKEKRGGVKPFLLSSFFSPPTWIIWGVTAALRAHYKSVHLLDYFAYNSLEPEQSLTSPL